MSISKLQSDPINARKHSETNLKAIASSLHTFGQRKPIVVSGAGVVIAGNGTLEAAKSLGWTEIAVTVIPKDWKDEQIRAYAIADNRSAELAEWDDKILTTTLLDLDANGWDISLLGFKDSDIDIFDVDITLPPELDDGDKKPFTQMTFTLHNEQAEIIEQAIAQVKLHEDTSSTVNDNGNANALHTLARLYLESL